jgi:hypothetical protein
LGCGFLIVEKLHIARRYADDSFTHTPAKFSYEDAYNGYMNWFQNVSANVPYMVSPG